MVALSLRLTVGNPASRGGAGGRRYFSLRAAAATKGDLHDLGERAGHQEAVGSLQPPLWASLLFKTAAHFQVALQVQHAQHVRARSLLPLPKSRPLGRIAFEEGEGASVLLAEASLPCAEGWLEEMWLVLPSQLESRLAAHSVRHSRGPPLPSARAALWDPGAGPAAQSRVGVPHRPLPSCPALSPFGSLWKVL